MSRKKVLERAREDVTNRAFGDALERLLAEQRHPTRAELDGVSTEHPVAVMHISGHMMVANSMALAAVGISAETEDPVGGVIARREGSREPNGLLEETARLPVMEQMQDLGVMDGYRMMKSAVREYLGVGVTTAQSGGTSPMLAGALSLFSKLGVIPQRLVLFAFQHDFAEQLDNGEFDADEYNSDRVVMGAVKIVADGSIQGYTGYLSHPYHVPFHGDADYRGYPAVPREDLLELLLVQDKIANRTKDVSGVIMGRKMKIPKQIAPQFLEFVDRNIDAAKQARKSVRELDELFTAGFKGAEVSLVADLIEELDRIETHTDEQQTILRTAVFEIEKTLDPVDAMFLYEVIQLTGEIADMAERVGRRLELLLS